MVGATFIDIFLWFLLVLFVVTVLSWYKHSVSHSRFLFSRLSRHFSGKVVEEAGNTYFRGQHKGLAFMVKHIQAAADISRLSIVFERKSLLKLNIYADSAFCELEQKIGGGNEVKSGDDLFDQKFMVFSNHPAEAQVFLADGAVKECIRGLVRDGAEHIKANGKTVVAQCAVEVKRIQLKELSRLISNLSALTYLLP